MASEYHLTHTAAQIDELLDKAGNAVLYTDQSLGEEQKSKARANIGAAAIGEYSSAIVCETAGETITVTDASNRPLQGLSIYGKTVQNGTPTPSAPVALESVGESIGVTVAGKNLLDMKQVQASPSTPNALSGAVITDECIDIVRQSQWDYAVIPVYMIGGKTYTLWCEYEVYNRPADATGNTILTVGFSGVGYNAFEVNKNTVGVVARTYTPTASEIRDIALYANTNSAVPAKVRFKLMLVEGAYTTATIPAFEPYKGQTLTATAEGGLHGIGEVKDEIDFARGVRVRRINKIVLNGEESFTMQTNANGATRFLLTGVPLAYAVQNSQLCSHALYKYNGNDVYGAENAFSVYNEGWLFMNLNNCKTVDAFKAILAQQYENGTPVTVQYVLATPIETPLSAEELAQFAALRSNKPNTTVFNDSGADMKLSYVADTKLYIDQKIAAISAALLNT